MAVKRSILFLSAFLLFQASWAAAPAAEWKAEARRLIASESDFPQLIESLQRQFPLLSDKDKAAASLIIGYCQSRAGNAQAELFWMNKYLGEFRAAAVNLAFLPAAVRRKINDFRLSWQKDFPVLWELALAPEHASVAYFDPPAELKLRLQASMPCDFQLLARDGRLLAKGVLDSGIETVRLPGRRRFFAQCQPPIPVAADPAQCPGADDRKILRRRARV